MDTVLLSAFAPMLTACFQAVRPGAEAEFAALCQRGEVPAAAVGTTGGSTLEVAGSFVIPLDELASAHRATLPALFS